MLAGIRQPMLQVYITDHPDALHLFAHRRRLLLKSTDQRDCALEAKMFCPSSPRRPRTGNVTNSLAFVPSCSVDHDDTMTRRHTGCVIEDFSCVDKLLGSVSSPKLYMAQKRYGRMYVYPISSFEHMHACANDRSLQNIG